MIIKNQSNNGNSSNSGNTIEGKPEGETQSLISQSSEKRDLSRIAFEKIELGPAPYMEACAQAGADGFREQNILECRLYIAQLKQEFPVPDQLKERLEMGYFIYTNYGDTPYREAAIRFRNDPQQPKLVDVAYRFALEVEGKAPAYWNIYAQMDLAIAAGSTVHYTSAPQHDLEGTLRSPTGEIAREGVTYYRVVIPAHHLKQQIEEYSKNGFECMNEREWIMRSGRGGGASGEEAGAN